MPWKGERDPYRIWLSEVILQQTRVAQGWDYYNRFIRKYPTIAKLAAAADTDVYKLWEGLGYYTRCKNLLATARTIVKERNGVFPDQYEDILSLKGVGPYTAAAIASFAYDLPYAVVDGNVFRVLSRYFGIDTPIDSTEGKKQFTALAQQVLAIKEPGAFNQAIMDFGATVCRPLSPVCSQCPLQKNCTAFSLGIVNRLPVKEKTLQRKTRWFTYFIFEHQQKVLVQQRTAKDIWQNLFEFYLLETGKQLPWEEKNVLAWLQEQTGTTRALVKSISKIWVQELTHQQIRAQFIRISLPAIPYFLQKHSWQPQQKLRKLAFPKIITGYLGTDDQ